MKDIDFKDYKEKQKFYSQRCKMGKVYKSGKEPFLNKKRVVKEIVQNKLKGKSRGEIMNLLARIGGD